MIKIKNKSAIKKMQTAGKLLAKILEEAKDYIKSGISTLEIDNFIEKQMIFVDLKPECKGYAGYKYATCISLNDVIVHGVPSHKVVLKSGDFVKIDIVGSYKNYCADLSRYFFVGEVSPIVKKIAATAQRSLNAAIAMIVPGIKLSDIGACVQKEVEKEGFGVVRDFAGHGIGKCLHEDPEIPNYGEPGCGPILREGMTLAIEPMITEHGYAVKIADDGWSVKTVDGGLAGHVEDTIVITASGAKILTRL